MTAAEVLRELETLGTEQNRKIYRRHGAGDKLYGVSFANITKLQKRIKQDQAMAVELWASGYCEARVLAAQIADPAAMNEQALDAWVKDLDNPMVSDYFSGLLVKTSQARKKTDKWVKSKNEWIGRAGWVTVARLAMEPNDLPNKYFEDYIEIIERDIHESKNRVRQAMNNALIAIGTRNELLEEKAIAAAKRVGTVEIDHGETDCKTPDAAEYIKKAVARKKR
jgi:3-methyladenine DNA glycosylase AlkD